MTSLWIAVIGILGTLSASISTQWLHARAEERQGMAEERRRISDLRREALAEFADTLMSFRRAQLHNWYEARAQGVDADDTAEAFELRELRASAWSALFRVQLLWRDKAIVEAARGLVDAVTTLKDLDNQKSLGDSADQIREALSSVMDRARESLLSSVE